MCDFCEEHKPLFEHCDTVVSISDDNTLNINDIYDSYYIDYDIEIDYCPKCGRKLTTK